MTIPLSLYIHFPWCVRKCPYCDFNSHELSETLPEKAYVEALLTDLAAEATRVRGREVVSIFLGGGTPSLFSADALRELLQGVQRLLTTSEQLEITLEANPGTTDSHHFEGYRSAGINRLSVGIQSFDDHQLDNLGRIHSSKDAAQAVRSARAAGFDNINVDLMHGLPGQSIEAAMVDLETAFSLFVSHISWYQLTIEPNTRFHKYPPVLPTDDTLWSIYTQGMARLESAGYHRYEVSAFAGSGCEAAHNLNYWQFGDYLGIGAGAHGKLTEGGIVTRRAKTRLPRDYLSSAGTSNSYREHAVPAAELPLEFLMNALRTTRGFSLDQYRAYTGLAASSLEEFIRRASDRKLINATPDHIRPSELGLQYLNELLLLVED